MSDAGKKLLHRRGEEVAKAGRMFFDAICGDSRGVGKKLAVEAARERGREDLASVIDAEFEDEGTKK